MYERIMVPLDGSNAAEMVLPYAEEMVSKFNSELSLVSVAQPTPDESDHLFRAYLQMIQEKVRTELRDWGAGPGTPVSAEVLLGRPAEEILNYAEDKNARLLVMASRGRSGEGPWLLGNIAAKVLRATPKPVLLVRTKAPAKGLERKGLIKKVLVPLDGSGVAEQIIPHAEAFAEGLGGELILFQAVEPVTAASTGEGYGFVTESTIREENKRREKTSEQYLDGVAKGLKERGRTVSTHVAAGAPAEQILDFAETHAMDVIAMSTHGRSGVSRWVFGSVTDKVLHAGDIPVLVVRATGQ